MILEMCIVQGSLQVIVHKEVASLWSEARTGATAAPEKSAIQSFEFWTELCIALLRRGGGGSEMRPPAFLSEIELN